MEGDLMGKDGITAVQVVVIMVGHRKERILVQCLSFGLQLDAVLQ